jgi:RNA-directed DNA polymerase
VLPVLQPAGAKTCAAHSDGFRPGRAAHQAMARAQQYLEDGYDWVVALALDKFFDRVNHDQVMSLVKGRRADRRVLPRIDRSLKAGVLTGDGFAATGAGTPQGGPQALLRGSIVPNTHYTYERIREGKLLPGVFEVSRSLPIGWVIDDLLVKEDYDY